MENYQFNIFSSIVRTHYPETVYLGPDMGRRNREINQLAKEILFCCSLDERHLIATEVGLEKKSLLRWTLVLCPQFFVFFFDSDQKIVQKLQDELDQQVSPFEESAINCSIEEESPVEGKIDPNISKIRDSIYAPMKKNKRIVNYIDPYLKITPSKSNNNNNQRYLIQPLAIEVDEKGVDKNQASRIRRQLMIQATFHELKTHD